jgi:hypothetical protein
VKRLQTVNKQSLTIDIRKRAISSTFVEKSSMNHPIPQFVQGDTNIIEAVIQDNGESADLSAVGKVVGNFKRQDNKVVSRSAVVSGNVVTYTLGNEEMIKAGIGELELQFFNTDESERLSTLRFKVNVTPEIGFGLEGTDGPTLAQELIVNGQYAEEQGNIAKQSAEEAISAKESAITNWLSPVADYSSVEAIANPSLGATVQTNDNGYVYRFDGTEWVNTQQYGATALANVNAQLAETLKQGEVSVSDIDKNKGKLDQTYMTDEFLQQMAGTTPINSTPANNSITTLKLTNKVVTTDKTNFVKVTSNNLFDKTSVMVNFTINQSTGEPSSSSGNNLGVYIPVLNSNQYTMVGVSRVAYYSENYSFISSELISNAAQFTITTPATAKFIRLIVASTKIDTAQINVGSTLLSYDNYKIGLINNSVDWKEVKNPNITMNEVEFLDVKSSNLINKNLADINTSFDNTTGNLLTSNGHRFSHYIDTVSGETLSLNWILKVACYSKDKVYLGVRYPSSNKITLPASCVFIRCLYNASDLDKNIQINRGSVLLPYEEYALNVNGLRVVDTPKVDAFQKFKSDDRYTIDGSVTGNYSSPTVTGLLSNLQNMQVTELIGLYDDLVVQYPDYITKSVLGQDSLGQNIYRYDFKPTPVREDQYTTKFPKMLLIAGIHGSEKAGVYNLYEGMKQICELWSTNDLLETLRWNVHFVVVPIVNNYGFNNYTRKNENGVDLARNFEVDWVLNPDPTDYTYGGEAPLTEQGSILVKQLIDNNKDAIYFGSFHNFTTPANSEEFIWNAGATTLQTNLGKNLVSKMSRKWKKEYDWLPQDNTTYFGYANTAAPNGSESKQAAFAGIQGSTFEVCEAFWLEPNYASFNTVALSLGTEAFLNWLLIVLKNNVEYYNHKAK